MDYTDNFHPVYGADAANDNILSEFKNVDRGHNVIWRMVPRSDGKIKRTKIDIYTSSDTGSRIRDAETGAYYNTIVGSLDEELFFKVGLSTGECKSPNGSSTLFYLSPHHYMSHMYCELDDETIARWEERRAARVKENEKKQFRNTMESVVVN